MPRDPILSRELFVERLSDNSLRLLPFAIVNTSLGSGIEPVTYGGPVGAVPTGPDARAEETFTSITEVDRSHPLMNEQMTAGLQTPLRY